MAKRELHRILGTSVLGLYIVLGSGSAMATELTSPRDRVAAVADDKNKEEEPRGDPVDVDKLPKAVVDAVKKAYPGAKVTKAAKLEDGNYYLDDVKVGKKLWDLTVTPKGEIVKQVEMKEGA